METPPQVPDHRLIRVIGRGAYGEVWLAENHFGLRRAVKVVGRDGSGESKKFERERAGMREFEVVSREHPGLVDVLQVGITSDRGDFFCVMELADAATSDDDSVAVPAADSGSGGAFPGEGAGPAVGWRESGRGASGDEDYEPLTLRRKLQRRGRLPARQCLLLGRQLAGALAFLHARGLVHRDVKPSNILFVEGEPRLADGGSTARAAEPLTEVGTRGYLPPDGVGTASADCFALGRVLHEAATGGDRAMHEVPTELGNPSEREAFLELQEIFFRACELDRTLRYGSGAEMERDFRRVLAGESLRRARQSERRARRFRRGAAIGAGAAVVLAGAWGFEARRSGELARLEAESRSHLTQLYLSNGRRALADGSWSVAALWFTEALGVTRDGDAAERLRWRVGAIRDFAPRLAAVGRHEGSVFEVAFSPDGRTFASASEDGTVQIHSLAADELTGTRENPAVGEADPGGGTRGSPRARWRCTLRHTGPVNVVEFSRDGRWVATGGVDGAIGIWEAANGREIHRLAQGGELTRVTFSPDGRRVAGAGEDGRIVIWDTASGRRALPEMRHEESVQWVEFSPDGRWLVSAAHDRRAVVWSLEDGSPRFPSLEHPAPVRFAAWSPDGRRILTAGADGLARFWNAETGAREAGEIRQGTLNFAGFSHDGRRVVTTSGGSGESGEVRVWDATSLEPVGPSVRHESRARYAVFSPDDRWLATAGHDGVVQLRRVGAGGESLKLEHGTRVWALAFSPDGRHLLTGGAGPLWRLWDLAGAGSSRFTVPWIPKEGIRFVMTPDHRWLVASAGGQTRTWELDQAGWPVSIADAPVAGWIAWTPDQRGFAGFTEEGSVVVWDMATRKIRHGPLPHAPGGVSGAFSPDGLRLYTGELHGSVVRAWNLEKPGFAWEPLSLPVQQITEVRLSHDGSRAAVVSGRAGESEGVLALLEASTGRLIQPIRVGAEAFASVRFSPDDRMLAVVYDTVGLKPTQLLLLDPRTGLPAHEPLSLPDGGTIVEFSPDGRWLAAGCGFDRVMVWSFSDLRPVPRSLETGDGVIGMGFSPDGRRLAAGLRNGQTLIWDTATGESLLSLPLHRLGVAEVRFPRDRDWLMTGSWDGDVNLLRLGTDTGSVAELRRFNELNAGMVIGEEGTVQTLSAEALWQRWERSGIGTVTGPGR